MKRTEIQQSIRNQLTEAGYQPRRWHMEVHTHEGGLRQGNDWDGGTDTLSRAYKKAQKGDVVYVSVYHMHAKFGKPCMLQEVVKVIVRRED